MTMLTQHQQDVLNHCYSLLGEHFDNFTIAVHTERTPDAPEAYHYMDSAPIALGIGMCDLHRAHLVSMINSQDGEL